MTNLTKLVIEKQFTIMFKKASSSNYGQSYIYYKSFSRLADAVLNWE